MRGGSSALLPPSQPGGWVAGSSVRCGPIEGCSSQPGLRGCSARHLVSVRLLQREQRQCPGEPRPSMPAHAPNHPRADPVARTLPTQLSAQDAKQAAGRLASFLERWPWNLVDVVTAPWLSGQSCCLRLAKLGPDPGCWVTGSRPGRGHQHTEGSHP